LFLIPDDAAQGDAITQQKHVRMIKSSDCFLELDKKYDKSYLVFIPVLPAWFPVINNEFCI